MFNGKIFSGINIRSMSELENKKVIFFYLIFYRFTFITTKIKGCPRGVMVKAMDCGIVVSEVELQSRYYVHFRANTLGKGMNHLIFPAMG